VKRKFSPDPTFLQALATKECMLEVEAMLLGKLASMENSLKGLSGTEQLEKNIFTEKLRETEEALSMLKIWHG